MIDFFVAVIIAAGLVVEVALYRSMLRLEEDESKKSSPTNQEDRRCAPARE